MARRRFKANKKLTHMDRMIAECKKYNKDMREIGCHSQQKDLNEYINYRYGRTGKNTRSSAVAIANDCEAQPLYRRAETAVKSHNSGTMVARGTEERKYTGTLIKGVATMHKSNAVPVFNDDQYKDVATMRRG